MVSLSADGNGASRERTKENSSLADGEGILRTGGQSGESAKPAAAGTRGTTTLAIALARCVDVRRPYTLHPCADDCRMVSERDRFGGDDHVLMYVGVAYRAAGRLWGTRAEERWW